MAKILTIEVSDEIYAALRDIRVNRQSGRGWFQLSAYATNYLIDAALSALPADPPRPGRWKDAQGVPVVVHSPWAEESPWTVVVYPGSDKPSIVLSDEILTEWTYVGD